LDKLAGSLHPILCIAWRGVTCNDAGHQYIFLVMATFEEEFLVAFLKRRRRVTTNAFSNSPAISGGQTFPSSYACLADVIPRSKNPLSLLELGCGDGYFLHSLSRENISLIGVDLSYEELRAAQSILGEHASLYLCRAQNLPLKSESVDIVLSHMALMLMDDISSVLTECKRVLKRGGLFSAIIGRRFLLGPVNDILIPLLSEAMDDEALPPLRFGGAMLREPKALENLFANEFADVQCVDVDVPFQATPESLWERLLDTYNIARLSESRRNALRQSFCNAINSLVQIDGTIHTGWGLLKITAQRI
jgi:ubiquinone/menaquinone biosynthesis C-methylase UbiE